MDRPGRRDLLARDCIDRSATPLSDTARWTALGDVAVLAQALDPLDQTLLPAPDNPRSLDLWRVVRDADGALAMEAREVTALARGLRDDAAAAVVPAGARSVVLVSSIDAIPPAITALTDLVAATGPDVGAPGALAAATALAKTSLLTARVLKTAAREPRAVLPELLAGARRRRRSASAGSAASAGRGARSDTRVA
jgi:hypothetical protein